MRKVDKGKGEAKKICEVLKGRTLDSEIKDDDVITSEEASKINDNTRKKGALVLPFFELGSPLNFLEKISYVIQSIHYSAVARAIYFLRFIGWRRAANAIGSLLTEFKSVLYAGCWLPWGKSATFRYYGLNPTELTDEQKKKPAILLLHGKGSNQSAWVKLAKTFQKEGVPNVFTLNSSDGELTDEDIPLLEEKFEVIRELYGEKTHKINLIGHSRGAEFALYAALPSDTFTLREGYCTQDKVWNKFRPEVECVIRLGSPMLKEEREKLPSNLRERVYEIDGLRDLLIPNRSLAPYYAADCGHVELLYDQSVHQKIVELVRP